MGITQEGDKGKEVIIRRDAVMGASSVEIKKPEV
jgi:hypothetical protein